MTATVFVVIFGVVCLLAAVATSYLLDEPENQGKFSWSESKVEYDKPKQTSEGQLHFGSSVKVE